jgi:hypothetical protein
MKLSWIAVLATLFVSGESIAQLPPTPDAKRYPQLAAMKTWLEAGTEGARHCARNGGLFVEASQRYRETRSEPSTVDELMTRHAGTLTPFDRDRLRTTLTQVAGMASGLVDLHQESASLAYLQMCIGRMQKPKTDLTAPMIQAKFDAALRCEREQPVGSLERKECVAAAFKL